MRIGADHVEALIDFINRSAEVLDVAAPEIPPETQQQFANEKADTQAKLERSIRDAREQRWAPAQALLGDVKNAVAERELVEPRPEQADAFQQAARELPAERNQRLPTAFHQAIDFLRKPFVADSEPKPVRAPKPQLEAAEAPDAPDASEAAEVSEVDGAAHVEGHAVVEAPAEHEEDPRVRAFVEKYVSDGFQPAAQKFSAEELAHALPPGERAAFLALPHEEQKFLASLDDKHQVPYAQLEPGEQKLFRTLEPGERGQFLAMNPDERELFRTLDPDERAAYLILHPDQRELVRQRGPQGREALKSLDERRLNNLAKQEPAAVAQELAPQMVEIFGHDPNAKPGRGRTQRRVAMSQAAALVSNFLQQKPGNVAHARLATLKALLGQPDFQNRLLADLEKRLGKQSPELVAHFRMVRPMVLEHADKLLRPDTDRESLLAGLEQAVQVSKDWSDAHPPRRKALRVKQDMRFRPDIRG